MRYRTSTTGFFTFAPLRVCFRRGNRFYQRINGGRGRRRLNEVRFVTKRGTNQFHGNGFWQAINSYFDANSYVNDYLSIPKPLQVLNDYGGSVGGPLWKNKLFFFVNFEALRQKFAYPVDTEYPTATAQSGVFNYVGSDGNSQQREFAESRGE